eukprot:761471-Hanusia_phi.AAC.2
MKCWGTRRETKGWRKGMRGWRNVHWIDMQVEWVGWQKLGYKCGGVKKHSQVVGHWRGGLTGISMAAAGNAHGRGYRASMWWKMGAKQIIDDDSGMRTNRKQEQERNAVFGRMRKLQHEAGPGRQRQ